MVSFIEGTVTDGDEGIESVTVEVRDSATDVLEATTTTDEDGTYLTAVSADTYDVTAKRLGYETETQETVHVGVDETVEVNFTLPNAETKIIGEIASESGIGVLGASTTDQGIPIGIYGTVGTSDGYGFYTPDDIRVEGDVRTLDTWRVTVTKGKNPGNVVHGAANFMQEFSEGSTISGGFNHTIDGDSATIGGGEGHIIDDRHTTVGGGQENEASGRYAVVSGGRDNVSSGSTTTVGGGANNVASRQFATVGGGINNEATADSATIAGGGGSQSPNIATGRSAAIGGGTSNEVDAQQGTIAGGSNNTVTENRGTIAGGQGNTVSGDRAAVGGGRGNVASGNRATVGGGGTTPFDDYENVASGTASTVPGGENNTADGDFSFAAGRGADTNGNDGSFVFANSDEDTFSADAENEAFFQMPINAEEVNTSSSRTMKAGIEPVDPGEVLEKVRSLEVSTWEWSHREAGRHMGPMAEDFAETFELGDDEETIGTIDANGVALAAIQGLSRELDERSDRIDELRTELEEKDARIETLSEQNRGLEERIAAIERKVDGK